MIKRILPVLIVLLFTFPLFSQEEVEENSANQQLDIEQALEQIVDQGIDQTIEESIEQTISQIIEQTEEPANEAAVELTEKITTETAELSEPEIETPTKEADLEEKITEEAAEDLKEELQPEAPVIEKKQLSIPGEDRPEVERFRQMYLDKKGEKLLQDSLEKAISYRLYVRHSISEKELPPELEYLPVVESNYKTSAKSRSGAIGLWQFMENSVKPFLTLNDYVDERYDPWKSTEAALKKLTDNYNYYKDWPLAIGAYNCGLGAMNKALSKSKVKDFWYLCENNLLPTQTALYVPKLLAIADLAMNSEYYGINLPDHAEEYEALYDERHGIFDYVTVKKAYSLTQLANEMRIDEAYLKQLNPSFIKGFTHPSNESQIRLPQGMEQAAQQALKKINPIDFPIKYKVVAGDSLWSISRKYGTTVKAICELNGINENDILRIGKIIYIPSK